jgi:alkyl hydroperoxide reductase subunit F
MYDLIIIGGGPAGCAAAVYAARKLLKTALIAESFGGQGIDSFDVQNWIGTPHISGPELAKSLEAHVRTYAGDVVTIVAGERVTKVIKTGDYFAVTTGKGNTFEAKSLFVASGGRRRQLAIPGADVFEHKALPTAPHVMDHFSLDKMLQS